ncbi:MAG: sensor histidine kinase N-terminal domain-containing protein [Betaproteobacteria bacterium]|nr:sensor histidine kinase N-terminal domain-containing protein [Betaproteobacteria bacterium]
MLFSYVDAHHEIDELFDAQLAQAGQVLLALANKEGEGAEDMGELAHKYQRHVRFQIWNAQGRLLLHSFNAPIAPMTTTEGFSDSSDREGQWRQFSRWNDKHDLNVQVSENHRVRDELSSHIAWRLLLPALFSLPLIGLWVWIATWKGLSILNSMASQIASRDARQLHPIELVSAPKEIKPMIEALNSLFRRVESARESEHRFTADAAHELRTPLAALQAQLDVAFHARDDNERDHSLEQLRNGISRASRLIDQMLLLARLDPRSGVPSPENVDLGKLAENVCADFGTEIVSKNLDFELMAEPECKVIGQVEWLRVLIRNLVDNAVRYTPDGGHLQVYVTRENAGCHLVVKDSGPGIPLEERESVLHRFYRAHQGDQPGTGLGLAIVVRIAELHGALFEFRTGVNGIGLEAHVIWGANKSQE